MTPLQQFINEVCANCTLEERDTDECNSQCDELKDCIDNWYEEDEYA